MFNRLWLAVKNALFYEERKEPVDQAMHTPGAATITRDVLAAPVRPVPPPSRLVPPRPTPAPLPDVSWGLTVPAGVIVGVTTAEMLARQRREEEERRSYSSPAPAPVTTPVIVDDTGTYSDPVIAPFGPATAPEPACTIVEVETYRPVEFSCPAPAPVYESPAPEPAPSPSYDSSSYSSDSGSSSSSSDW